MTGDKPYVRTDESGTMRVGDTRVSLDSIVAGFHRGESPEAIQRSYPTLTLEEVYGAVAHYLAHRAEVDRYLEQAQERYDRLYAEQERNPPPAMRRLRSFRTTLEGVAELKGPEHDAALVALKADFAARVEAGELTPEGAQGLLRLEDMMHRRLAYTPRSPGGAQGQRL